MVTSALMNHVAPSGAPVDVWSQAASATISVSPLTFLETECLEIESMLHREEIPAVFRRVTRGLEILGDYPLDESAFGQQRLKIYARLRMAEAHAHAKEGQVDQAVKCLEAFIAELKADSPSVDLLGKSLAQLLIL